MAIAQIPNKKEPANFSIVERLGGFCIFILPLKAWIAICDVVHIIAKVISANTNNNVAHGGFTLFFLIIVYKICFVLFKLRSRHS